MHVEFTPALGETLQVASPWGDAPVTLNFTAKLNADEYGALKRDGVKVQLWSDISLGGEWSEADFQDVKSFEFPEAESSTRTVVSLCRADIHGTQGSQPRYVLSLSLSVPQVSHGESRHSFTYRLLYPSGEIRWLGQFGENGAIVIGSQKYPDIVFGEAQWSTSQFGYEWSTSGRSVDSLEAARLAKPSDYAVWAIGREAFSGATDASLLFLVPRRQLDVPSTGHALTYAISASPNVTITVALNGAITASGTGSLTLHTYDARQPDARVFIDNVLASCSPDIRHYVALDEDARHVFLTPQDTAHPAKFALVPIAPLPQHPYDHRVRIGTEGLAALVPGTQAGYCISSPLNPNVHFFPSEGSGKGDIVFVVDPSGGEFTLSPVIDLAEGECQVSILSRHNSARSSSQSDMGILPTPPASPRLQPIIRPSTSQQSSISTIALLSDSGEAPPEVKAESAPLATLHPLPIALRAARLIFTVTAAWFLVLYRLFFRRTAAGPKADGGRPDDNTTSVPDEKTSAVGSYDHRDETEVMPITTKLKSAEDIMTEMKEVHPARSVSSTLLIETNGGLVRVALRTVDTATPVGRIEVEMNGGKQAISPIKLNGGNWLLEFDAGHGGLMKIGYT